MSRFANLIKEIANNANDAKQPMAIIPGRVMSTTPLSIRLKGQDKLQIPADLIVLPNRLKSHREGALETGNNVMIIVMTGGQSFYVLDKI
ncbi:DUF2577 family protein [Alkalicoccobacillus plakortidis]|uniref:DUF2577 domain-containing protein n=1 Tax=Alkalicoccobacillus plakortidis TaxID=444060 RepID=A0ABT0XE61_9BACI|nr:DUF2577 family protein [Alkalicoccobacillus plakortidis]MCM2674100.1 DUF2577 domain-containing protein [Alkalicoccobacillus plakortidis]